MRLRLSVLGLLGLIGVMLAWGWLGLLDARIDRIVGVKGYVGVGLGLLGVRIDRCQVVLANGFYLRCRGSIVPQLPGR